jgi:hypothetical protein
VWFAIFIPARGPAKHPERSCERAPRKRPRHRLGTRWARKRQEPPRRRRLQHLQRTRSPGQSLRLRRQPPKFPPWFPRFIHPPPRRRVLARPRPPQVLRGLSRRRRRLLHSRGPSTLPPQQACRHPAPRQSRGLLLRPSTPLSRDRHRLCGKPLLPRQRLKLARLRPPLAGSVRPPRQRPSNRRRPKPHRSEQRRPLGQPPPRRTQGRQRLLP